MGDAEVAFFKTTHIATKAEVIVKNQFNYPVDFKHRSLIRDITKKYAAKGHVHANEYDVAIIFVLVQLPLLDVSSDSKEFVKIACDQAEKLLSYAVTPPELYLKTILEIKDEFGLVKKTKKPRGDVINKSVQQQAEERIQKQYESLPKKTTTNKKANSLKDVISKSIQQQAEERIQKQYKQAAETIEKPKPKPRKKSAGLKGGVDTRLAKLKELEAKALITKKEAAEKRKEILEDL